MGGKGNVTMSTKPQETATLSPYTVKATITTGHLTRQQQAAQTLQKQKKQWWHSASLWHIEVSEQSVKKELTCFNFMICIQFNRSVSCGLQLWMKESWVENSVWKDFSPEEFYLLFSKGHTYFWSSLVFSPTYCLHIYYENICLLFFSPLKSCALEIKYRGNELSTPKITKIEDKQKILVFHLFYFDF